MIIRVKACRSLWFFLPRELLFVWFVCVCVGENGSRILSLYCFHVSLSPSLVRWKCRRNRLESGQ